MTGSGSARRDRVPRNYVPHYPAAVLWDMDGTLVDTEPYWIASETDIVARHGNGRWSLDKGHLLVGMDLRDAAKVIQDLGAVKLPIDDIVNLMMDGVIDRMQVEIPWRPGARELLADLNRKGVPCALVTMSWRRFADAVLAVLPANSFQLSITGDECDNGKPHPEPYLRAAAALGVAPGQCVAIEDSPTGVRSAVEAGCSVLAVPNVVEIPPSRRYRRIASLADVTSEMLWAPPGRGDFTNEVPRIVDARPPGPPRRRSGPIIATGLAVVIGATAGAWWLRRPDPVPPPPDIPVEAWAPYWQLGTATAAVERYSEWFREISPFWYETRGATDVGITAVAQDDPLDPFIDLLRDRGIAITPAIVDGMPEGGLAAVLADPTSRTAHVQTLVQLVRTNGFDGLDLDYEGFAFVDAPITWDATRPNWVAFIAELGAALRAEGKTLSVTAPPPQLYPVYAFDEIEPHVDRIRVMAYDYSVSEPGPIAPLSFVEDTIDASKKLIGDDNKIVLGVPLYGRNWVVSTVGSCPADAPGRIDSTQAEVLDLMQRRSLSSTFDDTTGEAAFTYQVTFDDGAGLSCTQTRRVHWVDAQGARVRVDLARRRGLGGVSLWALGFDSPATWQAISDLARLPSTSVVSTPTT